MINRIILSTDYVSMILSVRDIINLLSESLFCVMCETKLKLLIFFFLYIIKEVKTRETDDHTEDIAVFDVFNDILFNEECRRMTYKPIEMNSSIKWNILVMPVFAVLNIN